MNELREVTMPEQSTVEKVSALDRLMYLENTIDELEKALDSILMPADPAMAVPSAEDYLPEVLKRIEVLNLDLRLILRRIYI